MIGQPDRKRWNACKTLTGVFSLTDHLSVWWLFWTASPAFWTWGPCWFWCGIRPIDMLSISCAVAHASESTIVSTNMRSVSLCRSMSPIWWWDSGAMMLTKTPMSSIQSANTPLKPPSSSSETRNGKPSDLDHAFLKPPQTSDGFRDGKRIATCKCVASQMIPKTAWLVEATSLTYTISIRNWSPNWSKYCGLEPAGLGLWGPLEQRHASHFMALMHLMMWSPVMPFSCQQLNISAGGRWHMFRCILATDVFMVRSTHWHWKRNLMVEHLRGGVVNPFGAARIKNHLLFSGNAKRMINCIRISVEKDSRFNCPTKA